MRSELSRGIKRSSYTLSGDKSTKAFSNNNTHFREHFLPFCCRVMLFTLSGFSLQNFGDYEIEMLVLISSNFLKHVLRRNLGKYKSNVLSRRDIRCQNFRVSFVIPSWVVDINAKVSCGDLELAFRYLVTRCHGWRVKQWLRKQRQQNSDWTTATYSQ